jgi:hypothetical protein
LPTLGALAAEPLHVLADTAIVGHLGRPQIAALGLAGTVPSGTFTTFNFLTYGTTAVVARATGAGQQERAARLAAQALWVSLAIGVALLVVSEAVADPLLRALGRHGQSGHFTSTRIRPASRGQPRSTCCCESLDSCGGRSFMSPSGGKTTGTRGCPNRRGGPPRAVRRDATAHSCENGLAE